MSDDQYFAVAVEGLTLFIEDLRTDQALSTLWRNLTIPYFVQSREKGHVEAMAYSIVRSLGRPSTKQWLEQHNEAHAAFQKWSQEWRPGA